MCHLISVLILSGYSIVASRPVRVKCSPEDTVGDLKKLIAAQTGTDYTKIQLKKWFFLLVLHTLSV